MIFNYHVYLVCVALIHVHVLCVIFGFQQLPYLLDQTLLSISSRSRIEAVPPNVLNEIVAALEY